MNVVEISLRWIGPLSDSADVMASFVDVGLEPLSTPASAGRFGAGQRVVSAVFARNERGSQRELTEVQQLVLPLARRLHDALAPELRGGLLDVLFLIGLWPEENVGMSFASEDFAELAELGLGLGIDLWSGDFDT